MGTKKDEWLSCDSLCVFLCLQLHNVILRDENSDVNGFKFTFFIGVLFHPPLKQASGALQTFSLVTM